MHARNHGVAGALRLPLRAAAWLLPIAVWAIALPAHADVTTTADNGFVTRNAVEVTSSPAEVWRALVAPANWWSDEHTFSGSARNLTLDPVADGCFCEKLTAKPDASRGNGSGAGSVMHMRVVYAENGRALRMIGALGPLQSEAVNATLTITLKPTDKGTRILWEYVVGGFMRYENAPMAVSVDRMLATQMASLAKLLGPAVLANGEPVVRAPEAAAEPAQASAAAPPSEARDGETRRSAAAASAVRVEDTRGAPGMAPRGGRVWTLPPAGRQTVPAAPQDVAPATPPVSEALADDSPAGATARPPAPAPARKPSAKTATRKVTTPLPAADETAHDAAAERVAAKPVAAPAATRAGAKPKRTAAALPVAAAPPAESDGAPSDAPPAPKPAAAKLAAKPGAKLPPAAGAKPSAKAARKAELDRKSAEDKERADANAAFDAALGPSN